MSAFMKLTRANLLGFVRDRQGLFWTFFFPIFFIIIFGSIFGKSDENRNDVKFDIGIVAPGDLPPDVAWMPGVFEKSVPVFRAHRGDIASERKALMKGERRAVIVFPADMVERRRDGEPVGVKILTDPTQVQTNTIVTGIIQNVVTGIEQHVSGAPSVISASVEQVAPSGEKKGAMRSIDFLLPGILAMAIMQLGLFTAIPLILMREKGLLKRFRATPLPRTTIIGSQVIQRLLIALTQTMIIVGIGMALYKFRVTGSWPELVAVVLVGALTFICIGAVIASVAKTQESGMSLVQLANMLMMFLSSIFFPIEMIPGGLRPIVNSLPSTHLADLMRSIMLSAPSAFSPSVNAAVLGAWLVGSLLLASRVFRWD